MIERRANKKFYNKKEIKFEEIFVKCTKESDCIILNYIRTCRIANSYKRVRMIKFFLP